MLTRKHELQCWLSEIISNDEYTLTKLAGDASHRSYFRLNLKNDSKIIMDSPPDKTSLHSFIEITAKLKNENFLVPTIHAADINRGFLLLDDFGDELFLKALLSKNSDELYSDALYKESLDLLANIQQCSNYGMDLIAFDESIMLAELSLFNEWFIEKYLKLSLSQSDKQIINDTFHWLAKMVSKQPQVFIHRDYHSRNLIVLPQDPIQLGIIDYQDAMRGPFTYDLVSILKDCYIQLPHEQIMNFVAYFYKQISMEHNYSLTDFIKAFDLCGLQRHIKVLGIFARLYLRDDKPNYLKDLPLTFNYIMSCLECYNELKPFQNLMLNQIQPSFFNII